MPDGQIRNFAHRTNDEWSIAASVDSGGFLSVSVCKVSSDNPIVNIATGILNSTRFTKVDIPNLALLPDGMAGLVNEVATLLRWPETAELRNEHIEIYLNQISRILGFTDNPFLGLYSESMHDLDIPPESVKHG